MYIYLCHYLFDLKVNLSLTYLVVSYSMVHTCTDTQLILAGIELLLFLTTEQSCMINFPK